MSTALPQATSRQARCRQRPLESMEDAACSRAKEKGLSVAAFARDRATGAPGSLYAKIDYKHLHNHPNTPSVRLKSVGEQHRIFRNFLLCNKIRAVSCEGRRYDPGFAIGGSPANTIFHHDVACSLRCARASNDYESFLCQYPQHPANRESSLSMTNPRC